MEQNEQGKVSPWLLVTLIVVILAAAGYFGWYFWNQNQTAPIATSTITPAIQTIEPTAITSPSISPSTSASPISTADWKTYMNSKYNYQLKYPSDWLTKSGLAGDIQLTQYLNVGPTKNFGRYFSVTIAGPNDVSATSNGEADFAQGSEMLNYTKVSINFQGLTAEKSTYTLNNKNVPASSYATIKVIKDGLTYYIFGVTKDFMKIGGVDNSIFDQMISTFQFTK